VNTSPKALLERGSAAFGWIATAAIIYHSLLRRPILNWGATNAEAHARLPGDELLENADGIATRAITIDAPAAAVWPWIAQMGPAPRGGAYTYDWIENMLGLDMHSSDRVLPEYQHPNSATRSATERTACASNASSRNTCLPHGLKTATGSGASSSTERNEQTRLISRNRFRLPTLTARIGMVPM
jgi:hypothetical protein